MDLDKKMVLVYIEGNLIENIIIQNDLLLFSDVDSNYKTVPVNEYEEGTDKYLEVESVFQFLEFDKEEGRNTFKELCLLMLKEGNDSFTFEDYKIFLEVIEEDPNIKIIR